MRFILVLTTAVFTLSGCAVAPIVLATSTQPASVSTKSPITRSHITYKNEEYAVDTVKTFVNGKHRLTERTVTVNGRDYPCVAYADCLHRVTVVLGDAKD
ncbi:hypothetical protein [Maritimibacter sp. UBA3975]|uniref:hypothetical protein n=1 Tax=Maritimibacter sp. UBA3975 TaxID=1946833 RepID=UPI000C0A4432|nr:hypothetical protein [Maritimibacter sp. UBA3975]MAM63920.1 hypothetical protein [Maritimibacter sp.]|tara:strand:+ start:20087 stop:20386 length:300 start_codon:yes stop_codon:yes gene_type:complete